MAPNAHRFLLLTVAGLTAFILLSGPNNVQPPLPATTATVPTTIFVITPTSRKRKAYKADLTRLPSPWTLLPSFLLVMRSWLADCPRRCSW